MSEVKSEGQHLYDLYTQKDLRRERDLWRAEALAARAMLTHSDNFFTASHQCDVSFMQAYSAARKATDEAELK